MKLQIYFPFKPFFITQRWNNPNPAYEQAGFKFKNHNGVDAVQNSIGPALTGWPVYCPVEGFFVNQVDYMPQGGGNEVRLISKEPVEMGDRKDLHAYIILCHAEKVLVKVGDSPKLGELLMIADNTGFSTGPHTHFGLYRINWDGKHIEFNDVNDANGSSNPANFFTNEYAIDKASLPTLIANNLLYYRYKMGLA